jgi:hypothetical protein
MDRVSLYQVDPRGGRLSCLRISVCCAFTPVWCSAAGVLSLHCSNGLCTISAEVPEYPISGLKSLLNEQIQSWGSNHEFCLFLRYLQAASTSMVATSGLQGHGMPSLTASSSASAITCLFAQILSAADLSIHLNSVTFAAVLLPFVRPCHLAASGHWLLGVSAVFTSWMRGFHNTCFPVNGTVEAKCGRKLSRLLPPAGVQRCKFRQQAALW